MSTQQYIFSWRNKKKKNKKKYLSYTPSYLELCILIFFFIKSMCWHLRRTFGIPRRQFANVELCFL